MNNGCVETKLKLPFTSSYWTAWRLSSDKRSNVN